MKYFGKCSKAVQDSVSNRFKNELNDVLNLLKEENLNPTSPPPVPHVNPISKTDDTIKDVQNHINGK